MIPFSWDTETERFGPGRQAPPLVCVSYKYEGGKGLLSWKDSEALFEELLYNDEYLLIGHNIAYDLAVLIAQFPRFLRPVFEAYEKDRIADTMIRQKLLDNTIGRFRGYGVHYKDKDGAPKYRWHSYGYNLDDCYYRATKKRLDKDTWRTRYGELRDIPIPEWPQGAKDYAIDDAVATDTVYWWQEAQDKEIRKRFQGIKTHVQDPQPLKDQFRQVRAAWWLHLMRVYGIRTDPERVYLLHDSVDEAYEKLEKLLKHPDIGLVKPDGVRNTKAAKARMIEVMGGKDKCKPTDSGDVSLDEESCNNSGDAILMDYARLSSLKAVKSKDIPALLQGSILPIHSNFDSMVATGRTSSSKPNIQNIRRLEGIRECFVPRKGKVFLNADYDGLELRTLAQVCIKLLGRSKLGEILNSGKDPHLQLAAQIAGTNYLDAEERLNRNDEVIGEARQLAKVANFGLPGGLGIKTFIHFARGAGVELTEGAAKRLKAQWMHTYPEMELYFNLINRFCSEDAENNRAFIQHIFSDRIRGDVPYTVACNSNFQGLGADATKAAGFLIAKACYLDKSSPLYGCRVVNYIHDEFLVESNEDVAHEAAFELARLMCEGAAPFLPDVPPKVSKPIIARCWSKKAGQVWENGRLVPWDKEFTIKHRQKKVA